MKDYVFYSSDRVFDVLPAGAPAPVRYWSTYRNGHQVKEKIEYYPEPVKAYEIRVKRPNGTATTIILKSLIDFIEDHTQTDTKLLIKTAAEDPAGNAEPLRVMFEYVAGYVIKCIDLRLRLRDCGTDIDKIPVFIRENNLFSLTNKITVKSRTKENIQQAVDQLDRAIVRKYKKWFNLYSYFEKVGYCPAAADPAA